MFEPGDLRKAVVEKAYRKDAKGTVNVMTDISKAKERHHELAK